MYNYSTILKAIVGSAGALAAGAVAFGQTPVTVARNMSSAYFQTKCGQDTDLFRVQFDANVIDPETISNVAYECRSMATNLYATLWESVDIICVDHGASIDGTINGATVEILLPHGGHLADSILDCWNDHLWSICWSHDCF